MPEMGLVGSGGWASGWCGALGAVGVAVVGVELPGAGGWVVPRLAGGVKLAPRMIRRCRVGTVASSAVGGSSSILASVFAASVEPGSG